MSRGREESYDQVDAFGRTVPSQSAAAAPPQQAQQEQHEKPQQQQQQQEHRHIQEATQPQQQQYQQQSIKPHRAAPPSHGDRGGKASGRRISGGGGGYNTRDGGSSGGYRGGGGGYSNSGGNYGSRFGSESSSYGGGGSIGSGYDNRGPHNYPMPYADRSTDFQYRERRYNRGGEEHPPMARDSGGSNSNGRGGERRSGSRFSYPPSTAAATTAAAAGGINSRGGSSYSGKNGSSVAAGTAVVVPPPLVTANIGPLMTFKSFMQSQRDDLPPEVFQRKYDEYHVKYLQDFSAAFFKSSINEEWFQDRYNPVNITRLEEQAVTWAAEESAVLRRSLLQYPQQTLQAMCLDPPESTAAAAVPPVKSHRKQRWGATDTTAVTAAEPGIEKSASGDADVSNSGTEAAEAVVVAPAADIEMVAATDEERNNVAVTDGDKTAVVVDHNSNNSSEEVALVAMDAQNEQSMVELDATETNPEDESSALLIASKHLAGHEDRTLYLSGIHALCPKAVLKAAVAEALAQFATTAAAKTAAGAVGGQQQQLSPQRIAVSHPVWSNKNIERFERTAWVVMPTVAAARLALTALKDLLVHVPGTVDPHTGDTALRFSFTLTATMHTLRQFPGPDHLSLGARVAADTSRALELAALLDEDRNVPTQQRLSSLLEETVVKEAMQKPTAALDVALAYLRRVHFVTVYGGKRYRDESHLLTMAPSVVHRSRPYQPVPDGFHAPARVNGVISLNPPLPPGPPPTATAATATDVATSADAVAGSDFASTNSASAVTTVATAAGGETSEKPIGSKRSAADAGLEEGGRDVSQTADAVEQSTIDAAATAVEEAANSEELTLEQEQQPSMDTAENGNDAVAAGDSESVAATTDAAANDDTADADVDAVDCDMQIAVAPTAAPRTKQLRGPNISDRRVEAMISDVRKKLALRQQQQQDASVAGLPDEEDAKLIIAMQDKAVDSLMARRCKEEKEGKCRCCYNYCNKLFKGMEFLRKHLRSKHTDFAADDLVAIAAPFMRSRYEADDLSARPLPPVYVETQGRTEIKSVKEIVEKIMAASAASAMMPLPPMGMSMGMPPFAAMQQQMSFEQQQFAFQQHAANFAGGPRSNNNNSGGRSNSGEFRKRGHDARDQRGRGSNVPSAAAGGGVYVEPRSEDNFSRKIASYLDVDAPKESAVSIDYGVALLPPTKKRKLRKSL